MKFLILLIVPFSLSALNAQDTLTIAEIFDFSVGDEFHTEESGSSGIDGYDENNIRIVVDKYYSDSNDTIFYVYNRTKYFANPNNPFGTTSQFLDTVAITGLDSFLPIGNGYIDSVYSAPNYFNGRQANSTNFYEKVQLSYILSTHKTYVEGCGNTEYHYYSLSGDTYSSMDRYMVYFKKGEEEYGEPLVLSTDEIGYGNLKLFPNPTAQFLSWTNETENRTVNKVVIQTHNGQTLKEISSFTENKIDLTDLKPGLYVVNLFLEEGTITRRIIKE